jgi:hypothetical protein
MENIIDFKAAGRSRKLSRPRPYKYKYLGGDGNPNMRTLAFRSYEHIVEADEAELVRDVCFDMDRAQSKLRRVKARLKNVLIESAAQVELLTTAETKLTAAIVAALLSTRGGNSKAVE